MKDVFSECFRSQEVLRLVQTRLEDVEHSAELQSSVFELRDEVKEIASRQESKR